MSTKQQAGVFYSRDRQKYQVCEQAMRVSTSHVIDGALGVEGQERACIMLINRIIAVNIITGLLLVACGGATTGNYVVNTPSNSLSCESVTPGVSLAEDFVCAHNQVRATPPALQPPPQPPLPSVSWSGALAEYAQAHANKCDFVHSDDALRTATFGEWVGENLAANTGTKTAALVVASWAGEAVDYDYATNTCAVGAVCGHYTQLVWRNSIEIGCARTLCPVLQSAGFSNAEFWVCNYRPGGNIVGQKPY